MQSPDRNETNSILKKWLLFGGIALVLPPREIKIKEKPHQNCHNVGQILGASFNGEC